MLAGSVSGNTNVIGGKDAATANSLTGAPSASEEFSQVVGEYSNVMVVFDEAIQDIQAAKAELNGRDNTGTTNKLVAVARQELSKSESRESRQTSSERPAADGTAGKSEIVAPEGADLAVIAAEHGQTVDDLLLANPWLTGDAVLEEGTILAILDPARLAIAREMAQTSDPQRLAELVQEELLYATASSSTPEDLLPALKRDMLARRPGDEAFSAIFDAQALAALEEWTAQGRTHEIMDRLRALAEQGDSEALQQEILALFREAASASPTAQTIENLKNILQLYGPQNEVFLGALDAAAVYFNTGQVQEAVDHIWEVYETLGPIQASALLAYYTSSANADPLTAARILDAAQPVVAQIISHLGYGESHAWPGSEGGSAREFQIDLDGKQAIFGNFSETVQNVNSTPEAEASIQNMAELINEQLFTYVARSIAEERGVELPMEMLRISADLQLATMIYLGVGGLSSSRLEWVRSLTNTIRDYTEPQPLWSDLVRLVQMSYEEPAQRQAIAARAG